jgi:glycosyltransferase involved in cell wall biosynthesis
VGFDLLALGELGYEVDLLTLPIGEDKAVPGVRILRLPNLIGIRQISIGPSFAKLIFDFIMLFSALRLVSRNQYHAIHGVEDAAAVGVLVSKFAGIPLVFEKHSDPGSYKHGGLKNIIMSLYAKVEGWTIRRAAAVIGTGKGLVDQAETIKPGIAAHHIMDIPSSLIEADPEKAQRARASLQQSPDETLVLYVGSFAAYQGIDLLFEAIPIVLKECPLARFVIYGGSEEEWTVRKRHLESLGLSKQVTFAGFIDPDELPHTLAGMDILLSPRITGTNTPLKLLDYLKAGRVIVATDTEANRLILDETVCILGKPEPAEYAQAICLAIQDPERRQRISSKGHDLISSTYNYAEFKNRLADCYTGVLE